MVFKSEHLQTPKDSFVGLRKNRALSKKWTDFSKSQWETEGFFKAPLQSIIWRDGVGSLFPSVITDHLIGFNSEPSFPAALGKRWWKPQGQVVLCYAWQVMSARLGRRGGVERKQEKWLVIMPTHCQSNSAQVAMILCPEEAELPGGQTFPSIGNKSHVWQKPYGPWQGQPESTCEWFLGWRFGMGLQDSLMSGRQEQVEWETVTEVHAEGNIEKQLRLGKPSQGRWGKWGLKPIITIFFKHKRWQCFWEELTLQEWMIERWLLLMKQEGRGKFF